jgi:hypothetical protein
MAIAKSHFQNDLKKSLSFPPLVGPRIGEIWLLRVGSKASRLFEIFLANRFSDQRFHDRQVI